MENLKELLEGAITTGFEDLKNLEIGSQEYLHAANGIKELYKLKIEEERMINSGSESKKHEEEIRLKEKQLAFDEFKFKQENKLKKEQLKLDERRNEEECRLKETQIKNEEKRSKRIKPDVVLSCIASTVTILGILIYEGSGNILTTKAINWVPKIKL